jgi:hypothetical protein
VTCPGRPPTFPKSAGCEADHATIEDAEERATAVEASVGKASLEGIDFEA